jgi:hypothetical protein
VVRAESPEVDVEWIVTREDRTEDTDRAYLVLMIDQMDSTDNLLKKVTGGIHPIPDTRQYF